jgi:hypothetical protein
VETDLAGMPRAVGGGELTDRFDNRGELLVVSADASIELGELHGERLVVHDELSKSIKARTTCTLISTAASLLRILAA